LRKLSTFYGIFIYAFLYTPILLLILFSFNQSKLNAVWTGFTYDWYIKLLEDGQIFEATMNSLIVAFVSTVITTMIATLAAVGLYRLRSKGKMVLDLLIYLPIIIPEIVMGISLLAFFAIFKVPLSIFTLVIAHVTFSVPFAIVIIKTSLNRFDASLEEAAMDLGATPSQTFRFIILPLIMPGILASFLMSLTLSIDDVIISFFVAGPSSTTLPLKIFSMVKFGVTPEVNALSTLMIVLTLSFVLLAERIRKQ
jgi:spermidine/putrescine transport system permease protein